MGKYDDIIHLPHYQSAKRAHMPLGDRAAQFAPFAALTGYGAAVEETARLTDSRIELDEGKKEEINLTLQQICGETHPRISVTWFVPDEKKHGGAYRTVCGNVRKVDRYAGAIVLTDGTLIALRDVIDLECVVLP